ARPPNKLHKSLTPFAHRVEMLALAIAGQPAFRIDELEKDRPGPSFTVDTLEELHRRDPSAELYLLVGSDSLHDLANWYEPARIPAGAGWLVMVRPDWPMPCGDELRALLKGIDVRLEVVDVPRIEISSRDLRRRAAAGRSLRYFMPRAVEAYILDKGLYRE